MCIDRCIVDNIYVGTKKPKSLFFPHEYHTSYKYEFLQIYNIGTKKVHECIFDIN